MIAQFFIPIFASDAGGGDGDTLNPPSVLRPVLSQTWRVLRTDFPDMIVGEIVTLGFDLTAALKGARTVTAVSWETDCAGVALSEPGVDAAGLKVQVTVTASTAYSRQPITAVCALSDGSIVRPWATIRVKQTGD